MPSVPYTRTAHVLGENLQAFRSDVLDEEQPRSIGVTLCDSLGNPQLTGQLTPEYLLEVARGNVPGHTTVRKFGRNSDIDAGQSEDIWEGGGFYNYITTAGVLTVKSTNVNDTSAGTGARTVRVEGLDASGVPITEDYTLNGTTGVVGTESFHRVNRMFTLTSGTSEYNEGSIEGRVGGDLVVTMPADSNQSQLGLYTVPVGHTAFIRSIDLSAGHNTHSAVSVTLRIREFGSVFRVRDNFAARASGFNESKEFLVPIAVPERSDILFRIDNAKGQDTEVIVRFVVHLIEDGAA